MVWKQGRCSEKRHLPKGAVTLELKCPESEVEWDYHRRGQKTIRDTNLAVYSRKFLFRVNYSWHQLAGWFFFSSFYFSSGPSFIAASPKPPDGRMSRGLEHWFYMRKIHSRDTEDCQNHSVSIRRGCQRPTRLDTQKQWEWCLIKGRREWSIEFISSDRVSSCWEGWADGKELPLCKNNGVSD